MSTAQKQSTQTGGKISLPTAQTLEQAAKLSIKLSKPMCFYFYIDSCKGNAQIVKAEGYNIIYKNSEEHTSPIKNTYKVGNEYLVVTENTIYLISASTRVAK